MPSEILDRLQSDKLQALETLLESYEGATALIGGKEEAAAIADFYVDEGIGVRQSSIRIWEHHWAQALAGTITDKVQLGVTLFSLLDRGSRIICRGAELARAYAIMSGHEVARLSLFEQQSRAFPLWVAECKARWAMLSQPRKPINCQNLARSQAAYAQGEGEPVVEVIARLKRGEPLVKD